MLIKFLVQFDKKKQSNLLNQKTFKSIKFIIETFNFYYKYENYTHRDI